MLAIQKFLREHGVEELKKKFFIKVVPHQDYPDLLLFKYSQIESPMAEAVVQDARGIILDTSQDYAVVNMGFRKFFNAGEGHAARINWDTAETQDKLDGSLVQLYYYEGWRVATSGTPGATGDVHGYPFTFENLFWKVWSEQGYELPVNTDMCYQFELMTPYNKIVVKQERNQLVWIGARNRKTLLESKPDTSMGYQIARRYPLNTLESVQEFCKGISAHEGEGFVVCDADFNRIKVKSPQYVAWSHVKEGFGPKRILEVITSGESDEFVSYFPEYAGIYGVVRQRYEELAAGIESDYEDIKHIEDRKAYALAAKTKPTGSLLFARRDGNTGKQILKDMQIKNLMGLLRINELDFTSIPGGT